MTALASAALAAMLLGHEPHRLRPADPAEPRPRPAVRAVLEAFDRHPLVGIGEAHMLREQHDFLLELIRHPDFPRKARTIVVEFASARHQGTLDRFVAGEDLPAQQVRAIWRDTTQMIVWDAPVYGRFFAAVREVNRGLPPSRRLRVLAGDPPIDWDAVRGRDDLPDRKAHYAEVVLAEVLGKGRKALLIAGTAHLDRLYAPHNEAGRIERAHPGSLYTVLPHVETFPAGSNLEARLAGWPRPSLAEVRGTWLGAVEVLDGKTLEQGWDAFLYLGPARELTMSHPPAELYRDEGYLRDLDHRSRVLHGRPVDRAWLLRPKPRGYLEAMGAVGGR
jgi:hypothetical protein